MSDDREQQWAERRRQQEADAQARAAGAARRQEVWDSLHPWQRQVATSYQERVGIPREVIADQVLFGHGYESRDRPGSGSSSSSSSSSSHGGEHGEHGAWGGWGDMSEIPGYEKAKADWEDFKAGFAGRVQSVIQEMEVEGRGAWDDARRYASSGLAGPLRDEAYREKRPDYEFAEWMQTPGAREYYEWTTGEQVPEGHWSLDDPGTPLDHYRNYGRAEGTPYIDPEQGRYAHPGVVADQEFRDWYQTPGAYEYYRDQTGYGLPPVSEREFRE